MSDEIPIKVAVCTMFDILLALKLGRYVWGIECDDCIDRWRLYE